MSDGSVTMDTLPLFHRGGFVSMQYTVVIGYRIPRFGKEQRMLDPHHTPDSVWW